MLLLVAIPWGNGLGLLAVVEMWAPPVVPEFPVLLDIPHGKSKTTYEGYRRDR
jgi:hypothetical protein